MNKKIKLHFHKYILLDIFLIFITILFINLLGGLISDIKENKKYEEDYSYLNEIIEQIYKDDPSFLKFNDQNVAVIKMDKLIENERYGFGIPHTKDNDECVGYIIVTKQDLKLNIDYSHMCEMIDY